MRLSKPRSWRYTVHFCGWDPTCRDVAAPWYLYLNFLSNERGHPMRVDLTPPHVRRRNEQWFDDHFGDD